MAGDERKRQKKLERKARRAKDKKKLIARQSSGGLPARLAGASDYPVLHSWLSDSVGNGIGYAVLSRSLPGGEVAFANFLVDRWCLGVKDVFVQVAHRVDYDEKVVRGLFGKQPGRDVPPEDLCKYVLGAVEYAREIGFAPHADYAKGRLLLAGNYHYTVPLSPEGGVMAIDPDDEDDVARA
jgi:hypothetical protein